MAGIKRLQVYIEPELYEALRRESFRLRRSLSSLVRDSVAERYAPAAAGAGAAKLLAASGSLHDKASDVSERHDEYLWKEP